MGAWRPFERSARRILGQSPRARILSISSGKERCNAFASHPVRSPCIRHVPRSVGLNARVVPLLLPTPQRRVRNFPILADIVAKVFLGGRTSFFSVADAFYERRREGPYRFIQNRSGISVVVLKSSTAAEKSQDQLSRDFPGCSIFDFCNNIPQ